VPRSNTRLAVLFFLEIIVFGMGMALVERLLFVYLLNDLKVWPRPIPRFTIIGLSETQDLTFSWPSPPRDLQSLTYSET
jgi:hypothetical protein